MNDRDCISGVSTKMLLTSRANPQFGEGSVLLGKTLTYYTEDVSCMDRCRSSQDIFMCSEGLFIVIIKILKINDSEKSPKIQKVLDKQEGWDSGQLDYYPCHINFNQASQLQVR